MITFSYLEEAYPLSEELATRAKSHLFTEKSKTKLFPHLPMRVRAL